MAKESKSTTPEADLKKETKAAEVTVKAAKPAEAKKAETKKEEPKKEETKKDDTKAEALKKEAEAAAKKSPSKPKKPSNVKKESLTPELYIQYDDDPAGAQEANVADIVAKVKAAYVAEGHRESSIKSLQIYMKPQMWKAYYVINHKIEGDVDLF